MLPVNRFQENVQNPSISIRLTKCVTIQMSIHVYWMKMLLKLVSLRYFEHFDDHDRLIFGKQNFVSDYTQTAIKAHNQYRKRHQSPNVAAGGAKVIRKNFNFYKFLMLASPFFPNFFPMIDR